MVDSFLTAFKVDVGLLSDAISTLNSRHGYFWSKVEAVTTRKDFAIIIVRISDIDDLLLKELRTVPFMKEMTWGYYSRYTDKAREIRDTIIEALAKMNGEYNYDPIHVWRSGVVECHL
jgi:hypothetical protein